ncbi:glycosyltransferase family 39 protein [Micromonospora soli]|uniref:glycosyltransferase family 39 protein n=1 Tax=Micromonospora sp. NBRC 110009 TaxID=3061627 RepID=UPI002673FE99|nr:glycosyltransferase family 39 protein [Micromonospora sp. NBRC 110009]WKU01895.1 glycosyltransferase family 39 protein [Micromonospora sp. NBRC 110009]
MTAPAVQWVGRPTAAEVRATVGATAAAPAARGGWWALLPAVVALGLGWWRLDARDLWNDELVTWHATSLSVEQFRMMIGNIDLVHAFYYLIMAAVTAVGGDSLIALRLPSVLAIGASAGLIALIGRRLFGTPVGVLAGLFFALLPTVSRYAQEARSYALVTLAAVAATWLFLRAVDRPSRGRWWAYAVLLVVVGWLHFVALLVGAAHLLYLWRAVPGEEPRWRWSASVGIAGLFILPLLLLAGRQSGQISWVKNDGNAVLRFLENLTGTLPVLAAVALLALLAVAVAGRERRPAALMLVVWALLPPVTGYLTFAWLHLFLARYFLFTVPAWALLAAFGVCRTIQLLTRGRMPAAWLVGALILVPALAWQTMPAQEKVRSNDADGQPHYLDAVRYLGQQAKPGDGVAFNDGFGGSSDVARKATNYGLRDQLQPRDVFADVPARDTGWLTARECKNPALCLGDTKRLWLVETGHLNDPLAGLPPAREALLRQKFLIKHVERFDRVRVVLLERKPA